ncbi:MAG: PQQ-binding-like beta-propeller repeat protein [Acidobacteriia bacterium]|nr:PQQ-binding-like beta-propeller repeat protein [Terriglobia bacterium]
MQLITLMFCVSALLCAADWPQFRGINGHGTSLEKKLPSEIGVDKNVVWRTPLPPGHSSPILVGKHIFVTAVEGETLLTIAMDRASGRILWRRQAPRPRQESFQKTNNAAAPSPASDGQRVFVFFGDFGLLAYGLDGEERWRLPLGPFNNVNGHGSSPVVIDGMVILICDQDTGSYLLALDAVTGKVKWKTERAEVTRGYSNPGLWRPKSGPAELVVPGAYQTIGYALETGEKLWWARGMAWQLKGVPVIDGDVAYINSWETGGDTVTPPETPTFQEMLTKYDADKDGTLTPEETGADLKNWYINNDLNFNKRIEERDWLFWRLHRSAQNSVLGIRLGGRGDVTDSHVLWRYRKAQPNVPSPLLYGGALFLVKDGGIATTLDPKTGEVIKQARLPQALERFWSSPVGADGKVYMLSEACKLNVLKAAGEWEVLATSSLDDECFATPAIADGRIYLRTRSALYAFGK